MNRVIAHLGPPLRALRGVLGNRPITRMELAFLLFNVAEPAMWVAILVYAFNRGGTQAVGFVSILLMVPAGVLAPVVASLGDRFPKERVVRIGYLAQAGTSAVVGAAIAVDAATPVVYGLATLAATTYTTGRPNHHALLPGLARTPEELAAANSVSSLMEGVGGTIGAIAAAATLAASGAGAVYGLAAGAVAVAAALTLNVHAPRHGGSRAPFRPWSLITDTVDGLAAVVRLPEARAPIVLAAVLTATVGAIGVLTVPLAIDTLDLGEPGVGYITTMISVGLLVGASASVVLATGRRLAVAMLVSAAWFAASGVLYGVTTTVMVAAIASIAYGSAITLLDVLGRTVLQRTASGDVLTRVFGAVEALWMLGYGAGAAVAPFLERAFGLGVAFAVCGGAMLVAALVALPGLRRIDERTVEPERQLSLLRRIPMFAPLPPLDLERIARQLDLIQIVAGTEVIRQADVGDRFYAVDAGSFEIVRDGTTIATAVEGDYFGEIALLHDVPRTATVRATSDGAVWALDQEEFLATVTGLPQAENAAHAISKERRRTMPSA
ncbi:MAG: cyclic nucleotide-binding domain-containing protein [Actinomycetota bacterium]